KRAVERKDQAERSAIDERLEAVREERSELTAFLQAIGYEVVFRDYREQPEASLVEEFLKLYGEKKEILKTLEAEGDSETAEHVKALYAQEQARLFEDDNSSYS